MRSACRSPSSSPRANATTFVGATRRHPIREDGAQLRRCRCHRLRASVVAVVRRAHISQLCASLMSIETMRTTISLPAWCCSCLSKFRRRHTSSSERILSPSLVPSSRTAACPAWSACQRPPPDSAPPMLMPARAGRPDAPSLAEDPRRRHWPERRNREKVGKRRAFFKSQFHAQLSASAGPALLTFSGRARARLRKSQPHSGTGPRVTGKVACSVAWPSAAAASQELASSRPIGPFHQPP